MTRKFLLDKRILFFGKLAGMSRRDAERLAREAGGKIAGSLNDQVNLIVVGEAETAGQNWMNLVYSLETSAQAAFERGDLEIITETEFWQQLDVETPTSEVPLYTPAMIAELVKTPVSVIRQLYKRRLLHPVKTFGKLPYFDAQEVLVAKKLVMLVTAGFSPDTIEKTIASMQKLVPETVRVPLFLVLSPTKKEILLRYDGKLFDDHQQKYFCFEETEAPDPSFFKDDDSRKNELEDLKRILSELPKGDSKFFNEDLLSVTDDYSESGLIDRAFQDGMTSGGQSAVEEEWTGGLAGLLQPERSDEEKKISLNGSQVVDLCQAAWQKEQEENWEDAVRLYRCALLLGGMDVGICFQLAELLYHCGEYEAARERYFMVLEQDNDYQEARIGLGRTMIQLGDTPEAVAVFQGILEAHPECAAVHFELGSLFFRLKQYDNARRYLEDCLYQSDSDEFRDAASEMLRQMTQVP